MNKPISERDIEQARRDQMLKLVTKGFYNELVKYGVQREEVLRVASHLLDNVMAKEETRKAGHDYYDNLFTMRDVKDEWAGSGRIEVGDVTLVPLQPRQTPQIADWLARPGIRELFVPAFPEDGEALEKVLFEPEDSRYFAIECNGVFVGIIGGEKIDRENRRLEMKKLVGAPDTRGRGVGKRATFAFLFHAFRTLEMHKVYVHSRDINMRNINLNSHFGFLLEGIFLEDLHAVAGYQDVVRMALFRSFWEQIFAPTA